MALCADAKQREKALKLKQVCKGVVDSRVQDKTAWQWVITGVPESVNMQEIKDHLKVGALIEAKHLQMT